MPLKMQYPVLLHKDTKCPTCNTGIISLGLNNYVCQTGHMIEAVLIVTLLSKKKQEQVNAQPTDTVQDQEQGPLTPSYDKKVMQ